MRADGAPPWKLRRLGRVLGILLELLLCLPGAPATGRRWTQGQLATPFARHLAQAVSARFVWDAAASPLGGTALPVLLRTPPLRRVAKS